MTSAERRLGKRIGLALVLFASAQVGTSAATQPTHPQPAYRPAPLRPHPVQVPLFVRDRVNDLGQSVNGRVGIAVRFVDDGWTAGWKANELYPQQSVSKLWVAITALDAADRGRVRLSDQVSFSRSD